MTPLSCVRALAVEGGGVNGLGYQVPLQVLEEQLPRGFDSLESLAGTSAGAITCASIALGADSRALDEIVDSVPWGKFVERPFGLVGLWRLVRHHGWNRISGASRWLRETFANLGASLGLTFSSLRGMTGRRLLIPAVNESRGRLAVFGSPGLEDVPILDAVTASMAIPLFWPPVLIGGDRYSDGGLVANHPVAQVAEFHIPEETLGLRVDSASELRGEFPQARSFIGRALNLVRVTRFYANQYYVPEEYWPRIVRIDVGASGFTDFEMSPKRREFFRRRGRDAMEAFLKGGPHASGLQFVPDTS